MRRLACTKFGVVLVSGVLAAAPVPASASHTGGCYWVSQNDPSGEVLNPDTQTGVIVAAVVGADTVNCWIEVNGSQATSTAGFTGINGVVVGTHEVTYTAPQGSVTTLCEQIGSHPVTCGRPGIVDAVTGGCTTTYVTTVGNRPIPTAPLQLPGYVLVVVGDTLVFVSCVA